MKKKLTLGALALISALAFAKTMNNGKESTQKGKFWRTVCTEVGRTATMECCYYVFWINTGCKTVNVPHGEVEK